MNKSCIRDPSVMNIKVSLLLSIGILLTFLLLPTFVCHSYQFYKLPALI